MGEAELAGLYSHHREGLVRAAARLLGDRAAAEDVVQETWVKAIERYGHGQPQVPLPAAGWFYRVALNLCYDRLRATKRAATAVPAAGDPDRFRAREPGTPSAVVDPQVVLLEAELAEAVRAAVDSLPPSLREVVLLREGAELKYREIAEAIGCPAGTVMSRLHLARERLKRSLGPYLGLVPGEAGGQRIQAGVRREDDGRATAWQTR